MIGLPAMLNAMVQSARAMETDLGSLRYSLAGGDAVSTEPQWQFKERFGVEVNELHGMTEVCLCSVNLARDPRKIGWIGQALPGVRARLVDEAGREVPPRGVGEILVMSEATMVGYWEHPAATAATPHEGWLRTGDLVRRDEDGYITHSVGTRFVGRKKQIIIRGGSNTSPQADSPSGSGSTPAKERALCAQRAVKGV